MIRSGVSPIISYVLAFGIIVSGTVVVVTVGQGIAADIQDTGRIDQVTDQLQGLDDAVRTIAGQSQYAQTTHQVQVRDGSLVIGDGNRITYTVESGTGSISSGARTRRGNVVVSADADASVSNDSYQGTDCYRVENPYLAACINQYGSGDSLASSGLGNALVYVEEKQTGTRITPWFNVSTSLAGNVSGGQLRTDAITAGDYLGRGEVAVRVKPTDLPGYTLRFALKSTADFLTVRVE